jgi:hypothetical protein
MEEPKRFLRYVLPGLGFCIEFFFFLWLLRPCQMIDFMSGQFSKEHGFGFAIAIFIGSGGLGFVLANLYHALLWCRFRDRAKVSLWTIDHRQAIEDARNERILCLIRQDAQRRYPVEKKNLSREDAWRVLTAVWHARMGSSALLESANSRTDSLTSIVHGLGTLLVGTVIAGIGAFFVSWYIPPDTSCFPGATPLLFRWLAEPLWMRILGFLLFAGILFLAQRFAFGVAVGHAQNVIEMVFLEDLRNVKQKTGQPFAWRVRPVPPL